MAALKKEPHPQVVVNQNTSLSVSGMPEVCMHQIKIHDEKPELEKEKEEGNLTIIGEHEVLLEGMSHDVVSFFKWLST